MGSILVQYWRMTKSEEAKALVKKNKKFILEHFANLCTVPPEPNPLSIFMAGSPGAGKTETARSIVKDSNIPIVHIDADAIRTLIPGFTGKNASVFQKAATVGVDKLYDHVLKHRQSVLMDTTFTPYTMAKDNVERSVRKGRQVIILYVYQKPDLAWKFTKDRELVEGRIIPREAFIRQFLEAPRCVDRILGEFHDHVAVFVIRKDLAPRAKQQYFERVRTITEKIKIPYSEGDLRRLIC